MVLSIQIIDINSPMLDRFRFSSYLNIDVTDVGKLASFADWSSSLDIALRRNSSFLKNDLYAWHNLIFSYRQKPNLLLSILGPAKIIVFKWLSSSEVKLLPIWDSLFILQNELSWLGSYPFISVQSDVAHLVKKKIVANIDVSNDLNLILPSHNNHFGHFIGDELPAYLSSLLPSSLLRLQKNSFRNNIALAPPKGISSSINSFLPNLRLQSSYHDEITSLQGGSSLSVYSQNVFSSISSGPITNAFLWSRFYSRAHSSFNQYCSTSKPFYIFMVRSGDYDSRIANFDEISSLTSSMGFVQFDPGKCEIKFLLSYLSNARCIIVESGTTSLIACMFSPSSCSVISLNSERYLFNPSPSIALGGIQYLIGYLSKLHLFPGKVVRSHPIESSDICSFSPQSLLALLNKLI